MEKATPKISVIVTLYNRTDFILDALNSVVNQSLDKELYEIIVVTNIDVNFDRDTEFLGSIKVLKVDKPQVGMKYLKGFKESRGDIITFLDDDDLYEKERLSEILKFFDGKKGHIYYHNSFDLIDDNGKRINSNFRINDQKFSQSTNVLLIQPKYRLKDLVKAKKIGGDFNMSSIAVSRSILSNGMALLSLASASPDISLFMESITINSEIFIDSRKLTLYRIKSSSPKTIELNDNDRSAIKKPQLEAREGMINFAVSKGNVMTIKYANFERNDYLVHSEFRQLIKEQSISRDMIIRRIKKLPFSKPYLWRYFLAYFVIYLILLIFPGFISKQKLASS
ncbi:MAG: glycosyltransferase family 2 protein [Cuniculiplasma sp.]